MTEMPKTQEANGAGGSSNSDLRSLCVHQLVSLAAARTPEAAAVVMGSERVFYCELEASANRLAHYLQSLGVGPDRVVGLCMERSIDQIVGALAILKAGGAYLPLDPSLPALRLSFMLEDAQAHLLLAQEHLLDRFAAGARPVVAADGADKKLITSQHANPPECLAMPEHLAYVIYTSGSTGAPKGVAILHRGLMNLVEWHLGNFAVTPGDRASYTAGLSFDAAVWELWPYLAAGACIHVPQDSVRNAPEALRDWLVSEGITVSFAPTPMAERLIHLQWPSPAPLRILLTGGDALRCYPPEGLPFLLVNNYGPTECTVVATSAIVPHKNGASAPPAIGRPIANTCIHILDGQLQSVAPGSPGEICVSGPGLARGYLNRPELTDSKFASARLAAGGQRVYRTGDIGRLLPDGQIAFLGRVDDQVKIRGFRVELGEIDCALREQPSVEAAAVVAHELPDGEKSLVAYVVQKAGAQPSASELKYALRSRLPEYMVPANFVRLGSMPLSSSGKIDRAALPAPSAENSLRDTPYVAPRTPIEERVAEILGALLRIEQIGVDDNFFMLGGHSLLGTQVIARMRAAFGVDLALRDIFEAATVADLSARVEQLLVARLEQLTDEEAQRELNALERGHAGSL